MTAIKPPGGPGGVGGPSGPEATKANETKPAGPSFQERVDAQRGPAGAAPSDPSQAVIADLRAGKISPNQAVQQLTDIAVQKSHAPPSVRPVVEARMRELLRADPLVQDLLRQMGAALEPDK